MNENPYLPTNTENDYSPFGKTLLHDLVPAVLTGLAIAFILFGLETLTGIGFPLVYSFPYFYPLRGIIYFDPFLGFCLQCLIYGIAVGFAKHFGFFKLGFIFMAMTHVASVFLCPYLT
jgi:hypothetical protein